MNAPRGSAPTLAIDPKNVEQDLARLALALMEFLRQLMEMQAIRRMEAGSLSAEQEEVLGTTLMQARARIISLAAEFGLSPGDLTIDLGPLGRLV
ncbi:MAG: gas vesicle protein [Methylobacterium sp.]|nr:MAG: gas vesicle protein [Methylobacterium sp.]